MDIESQLTDDQKTKVEALKKKAKKMGTKIGIQIGLFMFSQILCIIALNYFIVKNDLFITVMSFCSAFFLVKFANTEIKKGHQELHLELSDILNNK